ncbi:MAG: hypothetical protein JNL01_16505 [Bdellovibrionales bacterium]|nr:hypothetical protein [Bdellovibrionales bacterium]
MERRMRNAFHLVITTIFLTTSAWAAESTPAPSLPPPTAAETEAAKADVPVEVSIGLSKLSLVPPRKDWLIDKKTLVLIQGKETTITCEGNMKFIVVADEEVVKVKEPAEVPGKATRPCKFTLTGVPKTGHTNLIVTTSSWTFHRNLEIRGKGTKDFAKAEKLYKKEVKLTDPDPMDGPGQPVTN